MALGEVARAEHRHARMQRVDRAEPAEVLAEDFDCLHALEPAGLRSCEVPLPTRFVSVHRRHASLPFVAACALFVG